MIKDRVQKPLESVAEYRNRFYRMFVKTERGEQVGRDLFIDGLRSRTIRAKLRKQFSPINHTLQQIMAAAEEMERKFAANILEGEDYSREGDSSELVRARAELAALQNKFENMGFVSGPVTYMEQIAPKRPVPSEIPSVSVPVMPTPVRTAPPPLVETPVRSNESTAILELTKTLVTWAQDEDHRAWSERLEWLIIQAWRTDEDGDLLRFLFGSVRPSRRRPIVLELTIPLAQLADDLPLDIISQSDASPVPHVLARSLTPYLQWSACLEEPGNDRQLPSRQAYLNPGGIINPSFHDRAAAEDEALAAEEEAEEEEEEQPDSGTETEADDEEEEESEYEGFEEEVRDEARARKKEEIAVGKRQLELASAAGQPQADDRARDPELPKPEDGTTACETSAPPARRRRSQSPSPSASNRPPIRQRTDAGHRDSSPFVIPPSP
ncbi:hypothetical protein CBR_g32049 [Chara braunii]|uniref:Retrotransposon gag domain-containing protein n=1 Tax=Chara braunii TaxID=69332 RepID=A0A388LGC4_CHABU|nr:hypothetical protein CBR_g32049 [Chara braunii]|eukprot:GBG81375.1 hypothetical protein CBR_g32049 [Chara braunii]